MKKIYFIILFSIFSGNLFAVKFVDGLRSELTKLQQQELGILKKRGPKELLNSYDKRIKEEKSKLSGLCVLYKIYCKDIKRLNKERIELQKKISDGRLDAQTIDGKLQKPGCSEERPLLLIEKDTIERHILEDVSANNSLANRCDEVKKMVEITKEKLNFMIQEKQQYIKRLLGY